MTDNPTAAMLVIGDEILSGRTRDANMHYLAGELTKHGITLAEVRIVSDDHAAIVAAVQALSSGFDTVFTSGGIGPTHDDITADAIAKAFGVGISEHAEVTAMLAARYKEMNTDYTPARRRMARIPHGASLIANPVSGAPGFQTVNVFTLAGVPQIARAMLDDIGPRLARGRVLHKATVRGKGLREGDIAEALGALAEQMRDVAFGSYPWFRSIEDNGVQLVASTLDSELIEVAASRLEALVRSVGVTPERIGD